MDSGSSTSPGPADFHAAMLLQAVKYMNVASITILVWDYLLTLEREILFVWNGHWSTVKILYILSRFPPFFDVPLVLYYSLTPQIPIQRCHPIYSIASWFTIFGIVVAEAILMRRTVALWGIDKRVSRGLLILMIAITIPCAVLLALFLQTIRYGTPPLPTVTGCYPTEGSVILFVDFILLILYESIMLGLTMWAGVKKFRHSRNPLVVALYRDGIFYFVYTFAISLGNIIVLVTGPPELIDLLNTFQRVMHSILSTRVILHVRTVDSRVQKDNLGGTAAIQGGGGGGGTFPLSAIRFATSPGTGTGTGTGTETTRYASQSESYTTGMIGLDTRGEEEEEIEMVRTVKNSR